MKSLQETIYDNTNIIYENKGINCIYNINEQQYVSIFRKIDIYNRNNQFINEGYTGLSNNILYNSYERITILDMLNGLRQQLIYNCVNESFSFDDAKELLKKGKEKVTSAINDIVSNIPNKIVNAYEVICNLIEQGIKNVKDLISGIGKILAALGDNIIDALSKFGLFNKEFSNIIPDTKQYDNVDKIISADKDNQRVLNFICHSCVEGLKQKNNNINEGVASKALKGGAVAGALFAPHLAAIAAAGYGGWKLMKWGGDKLSDKFEPLLTGDKSKGFANKLYNNKFARYSLGLKIEKPENNDNKLIYFLKCIGSIIVNFVIAWIITSILTLFIGTLFCTGPWTAFIVASIIASKNIVKAIINRILNFKKVTVDKKGKEHINKFFDTRVMLALISSFASVILRIPGLQDWLAEQLFGDNGIGGVMAQEANKINNEDLVNASKHMTETDLEEAQLIFKKGDGIYREMLKGLKIASDNHDKCYTLSLHDSHNMQTTDGLSDFFTSKNTSGVLGGFANIDGKIVSTIEYMSETDGDNGGTFIHFAAEIMLPKNVNFEDAKVLKFIIDDDYDMYNGVIDISGKILKCSNKKFIGKTIEEVYKTYVKN